MQTQVMREGRLVWTDTDTDPEYQTDPEMLAWRLNQKVPRTGGLATRLNDDPLPGQVETMPDKQPWVWPSSWGNDFSDDDAGPINAALEIYGQTTLRLVPFNGYRFASSAVGHEGQYIRGAGMGVTIVSLAAGGFPAFQWTNANPSVLVSTAPPGGGILGGLTVVGTGGLAGANPSDGSIAVQMGDITKLRCKIQPVGCQYGLLGSNQNFFTEQGVFEVQPQSCTNPVVLRCAATGAGTRTGSFDRCEITVYHNDFMNGSYGLGGVQLLAGANITSGKVKQYGNFNAPGGTAGQAGVYALYINGSTPAGAGLSSNSGLFGTQVIHGVEFDGTSNNTGTILLGSGNSINGPAFGGLNYINMGSASIATANSFQFDGPINGDNTLLLALWDTAISSGFPSGWSGTINFRISGSGDLITVSWSLAAANGTVVTFNEQIATVPAGFIPITTKFAFGNISEPGAAGSYAPAVLTTGGAFSYGGAGFTASGTQFWVGQATYSLVV